MVLQIIFSKNRLQTFSGLLIYINPFDSIELGLNMHAGLNCSAALYLPLLLVGGSKMSNMHRIMWFDQELRRDKYPNRITLAEQFEISVRQAQRDIDYLKDSLGAPLCYDSKRKGYYYEDDSFTIPNIHINTEQKKLLSFLAYSYENYPQSPKVKKVAEFFRRLTEESETDGEIPVFNLEKPAAENYAVILGAIKNKNKAKITYKHPQKGNIDIIIDPYRVFYKYRADHLACYCEEMHEIVSLRLDRILNIEVLKENFVIKDTYNDRKYSSFMEQEPYKAKIRFSRSLDSIDLTGFEVKPLTNNIYEIEFFNISDFVNQIIARKSRLRVNDATVCDSGSDSGYGPGYLRGPGPVISTSAAAFTDSSQAAS
jgi:predicted DNA-binding transcriptional regulator YafY